jgi:hypothetical protein
MANFNFTRLINKYSTEFTAVIPAKGYYDMENRGVYVQGKEQKITLTGAIISHRESKVFRSEGTITQQDKALYMLKPLEKALQGAKVIHKGKTYRIGETLDNGEYTGVWHYNLKYVSSFEEGGKEND